MADSSNTDQTIKRDAEGDQRNGKTHIIVGVDFWFVFGAFCVLCLVLIRMTAGHSVTDMNDHKRRFDSFEITKDGDSVDRKSDSKTRPPSSNRRETQQKAPTRCKAGCHQGIQTTTQRTHTESETTLEA